jgi:Phospholipase_D-nuclease N-terminal
MKLLIEILLAIFLHPIAVILAWINIIKRGDLSTAKKILWAIVCIIWGIGPILYVLLGDGALW